MAVSLCAASAAAESEPAMGHGWKPGQDWAECRLLRVTSRSGTPVANATVSLWHPASANQRYISGEWTADGRGRVCEPELLDGGHVDVIAPELVGGECAGMTRVELPPWEPSSGKPPVTQLVLDVKPVRRAGWKGRVVDEGGVPIAGATIVLRDITWTKDDGAECAAAPDVQVGSTRTGAFWLPIVPRGDALIEVSREGYLEREESVSVPGPPQDIVLTRGGSWSGRVIGPDGAPIEQCGVMLETPRGRLIPSSCSPNGFQLQALPAGNVTVKIRLSDHPLLGTRVLSRKLQLGAADRRVEDIQWPLGEFISGQLVRQAAGVPVRAMRKGKEHGSRGSEEVSVVTGAEGRFVFHHLTPGTWVLSAGMRSRKSGVEAATGTRDVRLAD